MQTQKIEIPKIDDLVNYDDYDDELDEDVESETIIPETNRNINAGAVVTEPPTTTSTSTQTPTKTEQIWIDEVIPETTTFEKPIDPLTSTTREVITTITEEVEIPAQTTTEDVLTTTSTPMPSTSTESSTLLWSSSTIKLTTEDEVSTVTKQTTQRHVPSTPKTTTEYIETEVKNFPPNVRKRLDRMAVRAGKLFTYTLPKDTFWDMEDGDDLKYEVMTVDREPLRKDSWLQFNPEKREFYGL